MTALDDYLMENDEEAIRLEVKTSPQAVLDEARWCGLAPGMRVLDAGCGPGFVTSILHGLLEPGGYILGVDYSRKRIEHARERYGRPGKVEFKLHDLRQPLDGIGRFDLVWARFVLEYFREEARLVVENISSCLKPGGILCLLDLDYNCLTHYELPTKMEELLLQIMGLLQREFDFDPYAGRKLYSHLYDLGYEGIEINLKAHHLLYGHIPEQDVFNWTKKIEVASKKAKSIFSGYQGGFEGFWSDFNRFFLNPRRFTYTPLIVCKGTRPRDR